MYGGGHASIYFHRYLKKRGIKIEAIIDKERKGNIAEIPILSFSEVKKLYDINNSIFVISAPSYKNEIKQILSQYVRNEQIYYFEVEIYDYYGTDYKQYKSFLIDNREKLAQIYETFVDEYSKKTMLRVIEGRLTGNLDVVEDIWQKNQYWPEDIIKFSEEEVIIECGSCDGKTIMELCSVLNNKYKHIYLFEPDQECEQALKKVINEISKTGKDITLFQSGTYKESGELSFSNEGVSSGLSKIDEFGTSKIDVVAIDDVIDDFVTYIKMDIEGAELDTLKGAKNIIEKCKPKLAVCVYHKDEDLVSIISYL